MTPRLLLSLPLLALATPALAQHEGHGAPTPPPAAPATPAPATDPHAGHAMPAPTPATDPHAGHAKPAPAAEGTEPPPVGDAPAPPPPTDHAAERFFSPQAMAAARAQLSVEHGGSTAWKVMLSQAEVRPRDGDDAWGWEGEAWYGGDRNRLVLKTSGEGTVGGDLESAELQALWSRPIGPYFDVQAGIRHDFEPGPSRTYAVFGVEGLAPYWFELEAAAFVSNKGDVSARFEAAYDLRLTQKLILEPSAELELAAQSVPELEIGSGLTSGELGLRLRYEFKPEFAPYIGVMHERKFGGTADFARAHGEKTEETMFVLGLRAWF